MKIVTSLLYFVQWSSAKEAVNVRWPIFQYWSVEDRKALAKLDDVSVR